MLVAETEQHRGAYVAEWNGDAESPHAHTRVAMASQRANTSQALGSGNAHHAGHEERRRTTPTMACPCEVNRGRCYQSRWRVALEE